MVKIQWKALGNQTTGTLMLSKGWSDTLSLAAAQSHIPSVAQLWGMSATKPWHAGLKHSPKTVPTYNHEVSQYFLEAIPGSCQSSDKAPWCLSPSLSGLLPVNAVIGDRPHHLWGSCPRPRNGWAKEWPLTKTELGNWNCFSELLGSR